jgi:N-ethylmaleimide reductase
MSEVLDAVIEVFGSDRVGIKLSPTGSFNDMKTSDPLELTAKIIEVLNEKKVAFLELCEMFAFDGTHEAKAAEFFKDNDKKTIRANLKHTFNGAWVTNGGFDLEKANAVIESGETDFVSFAKLYIANNDVPEKFASGATLNSVFNVPDQSKLWTEYYYGPLPLGYVDLSVYEPRT